MNYIKQLNEFYKNITTEPLTSNAKNLYETLLHINSDSYWREEISVANTYLILLTGLNISALQRARNTLIQAGYIRYKKGIGNNAGTYTIINLVVQNKDEFEQQTEQQTDSKPTINRITNRQESEHINKQNKTKTKLNKTNKEKNKKETEIDKLINENFTDKELIKTIYEFIKMRKAIKKPLTTRGLELMIAKLYKLTTNIDEQILILNNSIMNNWQGIFPLKQEKAIAKERGSFDDFKELWEEARKEDEQTRNGTNNNPFSW